MKEYEKLSAEEKEALHNSFLQDPESFYRKAEEDQRRKNLKKSYKERFLTMTHLMKITLMLSKAKITHSHFPANSND